jgi:putative hydrolase of the HAD superfamily
MPRDARAVVFDLDDTLYPMRSYSESAFAAVAAHLHRRCGLRPGRSFDILTRALDADGQPGHEIDRLVDVCGLPTSWLPELISVSRNHAPALRLSRGVRRALTALRPSWGIGVLTNGVPEVQARKVRALGLAPLVDAVVFATEHGSGLGKPEAEPFVEITRRLGVDPARTVFVGDDEARDVLGASAVGMRTICVTMWSGRRPTDTTAADVITASTARIADLADGLVGRAAVHAA